MLLSHFSIVFVLYQSRFSFRCSCTFSGLIWETVHFLLCLRHMLQLTGHCLLCCVEKTLITNTFSTMENNRTSSQHLVYIKQQMMTYVCGCFFIVFS